MKNFEIAFSSCPNDTFVFHAMMHSLVDLGDYKFNSYISDIDVLNIEAAHGRFPITKLSFHAYLKLKDSYRVLDAGSALGYGCGPLLVTKRGGDISKMKIAIPGEMTTAFLLLKLWNPQIENVEVVRFDEIMSGVAMGRFDAGLIIHEGRFVYEKFGLVSMVDLGEWWESKTNMPIPLGCIAIHKDYDGDFKNISSIISSSVKYAFANPEASREYIKSYAQELEDSVVDEHIKLYVNDFTIDLGAKGRRAIEVLEEMAVERGIL